MGQADGVTTQRKSRQRRNVLIFALLVVAVTVCIVAARTFVRSWLEQPDIIAECRDRTGLHHPVKTELSAYYACVDRKAELFLRGDFAETKDLSKAFLTLLTAVLVASITFSEKIVDVHRSGWWPRGLMITSWVFLLLAITACGTALALMTIAAGYASYFPHLDYRIFEMKGVKLFGIAGISFGCGLAALLVAGVVSLVDKSPAAPFTGSPDKDEKKTGLDPGGAEAK
jgi:hypothetical protein